MKLLVPFVLLAAAVVASVVSDRPLPPADFVFVNSADVSTLDLQRMSWMQDLRIARVLFEGLVRNDVFTHGYNIAPGVAERWEVSSDGKTYTFHLRPDARWSNGAPVTAHDFLYSWRRGLLPDTAADYTNVFWLIRGGREFYDWRTDAIESFQPGDDAVELWKQTERTFEQMVGLRAEDDRTFVVELEQPTPYFLDLCAFAVLYPVYPPLVKRYEQLNATTGSLVSDRGWTKPPRLVCNGPFKLTTWRFKRDMRLERNEHWWDVESLDIESIHVPSVEDPNSKVLAYQTGATDWVADVTTGYRGEILARKLDFYDEHAEEVARLRALGLDQFEIDRNLPPDPRKHIHAVPAFGTYFYNFNCSPKLLDGRDNPFADPRVRRAFAMAIDKRTICENIMRIGNPIARTLIPPNSIGGYDAPRGLRCVSDGQTEEERESIAAEARALLAEAGYPDPSRFITVQILFNKDSGHDLVAQSIAKNWQRYLGVPVALAQKEVKVFRDDLKKHNFMVARAGWYGDYGDPTTFLDLNRTGDGNNDRNYSSERYDGLLDQAALELDPQRRMALLEECERITVEEDLPLIPIYHYVTLYLFDPDRISGLNPHPRTNQNLFLIDVLGDGVGREQARAMPVRGGQ